MKPTDPTRRNFLHWSAVAVGGAALPVTSARGATTGIRLEWQQFKTTKWYTPYLNAVASMKANTNQSDRNSWQYWVNVHLNYCPHGMPYFCAWHRGYLYHLEQQFRRITGMSDLVLPYWDYYQYATIPSEFTDGATGNPLYEPSRQSNNVLNALTLAPFAPDVVNFPRGYDNAFEPSFETQPHNPVHNLIGGVMASLSSPIDPIFYLHHANVDRLWRAWVYAGAGRQMPLRSNSYWNGSFSYASRLSLRRVYTYDTTTNLYYDYSDRSMPSSLPLARADQPGIIRVQATPSAPALPPVANLAATPPGPTGSNTHSLGGRRNVSLDERPISLQLPVSAAGATALEAVARRAPATVPGSSLQFKSANIRLQGLSVTERGAQGGYFYYVYLNLPPSGDYMSQKERYLIGTLGPFEVDTARHHSEVPALDYPITSKIEGMTAQQLSQLTVSFVRVNANNAPAGPAIGVDEVRVELSTD